MRKKIYVHLILLSFFLAPFYSGQIVMDPFATFVDAPPSIATGIPNISIPLLSVPAGKLKLDFSLEYHPKNNFQESGDVGRGWALMGDYTISKIQPDYRLTGDYSYVLPGGSIGKFSVIKSNNTYLTQNLAPTNIKVEVNVANNLITSFKIKDENGYEYQFDKYTYGNYWDNASSFSYRNTFYITSIKNEKQSEVASYQYDYNYTEYSGGIMRSTQCKPSKVIISNTGEIIFDYTNIGNAFKLNSITLKNTLGQQINQYQFDNTNWVLASLRKYGGAADQFEKTEFIYNESENENQYMIHPDAEFYGITGLQDYYFVEPYMVREPWKVLRGVLKKIILPTGGVIDYEFELHKEYINKNTSNYLSDLEANFKIDPSIQYLKYQEDIAFDFLHRCDPNYDPSKMTTSFTIEGSPGDKKAIYIKYMCFKRSFPANPSMFCTEDPSNPSPPQVTFTFQKDGSSSPIPGRGLGGESFSTTDYMDYSTAVYQLTPGTYTFTFFANTGAHGTFTIYEKKTIPGPYKNEQIPYGVGSRIKSIKRYADRSSTAPLSRIDYEYTDFNNNQNSSGYSYEFEGSYINLYENVTIHNGVDMGYSQYSYKTPKDYPTQISTHYWPYLNLTKYGFLSMEETYDKDSQRKTQVLYNPVIEESNTSYIDLGYSTKMAFVKNDISIAKTYYDNGARQLEVTTETERDSNQYNVTHSKITNSDGTTDETFYKYASDKGVTHLINKNIVTTPLETEVKHNGETISKSEIRYEDPNTIYPSYNLSYNMNDLSNAGTAKKDVQFDSYDDKGNVVQYTVAPNAQGEGFPVTMIWGYNKTQLIAKIEGAKLNQLNATTINNLVALSNEYANASSDFAAKEAAFVSALESFRTTNSADYQITCYSYYPLIGVSQMIPPNGIKELYEYDFMNRLKRVKNADGVIIKELDYHNKP